MTKDFFIEFADEPDDSGAPVCEITLDTVVSEDGAEDDNGAVYELVLTSEKSLPDPEKQISLNSKKDQIISGDLDYFALKDTFDVAARYWVQQHVGGQLADITKERRAKLLSIKLNLN